MGNIVSLSLLQIYKVFIQKKCYIYNSVDRLFILHYSVKMTILNCKRNTKILKLKYFHEIG